MKPWQNSYWLLLQLILIKRKAWQSSLWYYLVVCCIYIYNECIISSVKSGWTCLPDWLDILIHDHVSQRWISWMKNYWQVWILMLKRGSLEITSWIHYNITLYTKNVNIIKDLIFSKIALTRGLPFISLTTSWGIKKKL